MKKQFLFAAVLSFLIYGCGTPKSALDDASKGNVQVPGSFNPSNATLLIEQEMDDSKPAKEVDYWMRKKKKDMMEYANANYQSKHEFASAEDIYDKTSKYSDKKLYRFALVTSMVKVENRFDFDKNQMTHHQPIYKFYLLDRLEGKTYSALGNGSSVVMMAFKSAIKKINEVK